MANTHRISLVVSDSVHKKLKNLRSVSGSGSFSEFIRRVIHTISWLYQMRELGYEIFVRKKDGDEISIDVLL